MPGCSGVSQVPIYPFESKPALGPLPHQGYLAAHGRAGVFPLLSSLLARQQIKGDAVALYTEPGHDFTLQKWAELDNCIYGELISFYERGHRPSQEELQGIVDDFKAGMCCVPSIEV